MTSYLYSVTAETGGAVMGRTQAISATAMTAQAIADRLFRALGRGVKVQPH